MEKVITTGYPRLHFSLVDMAAASSRMYGGFGISIKAYPVTVEATSGDKLEIETSGFIEDRTKENLLRALSNAQERSFKTSCKLIIHSESKQHIGLGSSTQIILTALDAVAAINNWDISLQDLIYISGRGRTSLIGFSTHYYGGFCIDAGQKYKPSTLYLPSHTPGERAPSLFVGNWDFPSSWFVSLIGMESAIAMDPLKEKLFMSSNAPLERQCGLESIAALYHGILPAVISQDYFTFAQSLKHIHKVGWNSLEMSLQSSNTKSVLAELWNQNFVAGLSSFGPTVAVVHTLDYSYAVKKVAIDNSLSYAGPFSVVPKLNTINEENCRNTQNQAARASALTKGTPGEPQ